MDGSIDFAFSDKTTMDNITQHIGYDLMGPVVHRWLLALDQYIQYLDDGDTTFLFCARAGVRIQKLYQIFQRGFPSDRNAEPVLFWISRIAVTKGVYGREHERALELITREYHHHPLRQLVEGLFRHHPERLAALDLRGADLKAYGFNFPGWLTLKAPVQNAVRAYLEDCTAAFEAYLVMLLDGKARAVLIDSGWQGSAQSLLARAYPEVEWKGLYFGRILTAHHDPTIVPDIIGLMFERDDYDPALPESAFARHRHLVECLLEPHGPSIEEIPATPFTEAANRLITANSQEEPDPEKDCLYLHVCRYLEDNAISSLSQIVARHQVAMPELARIIITPTGDEAQALHCKDRSADFGKTLMVPVLRDPRKDEPEKKDRRIREALWPEGQAALEYDGAIARDLQMRMNGLLDDAAWFDPCAEVEKESLPTAISDPAHPKVAIITRTKNRPLLLKRAAASVIGQTYPDYVWVVVNDGGDEVAVCTVIEECAVDRRRVLLVSNPQSLGMEAASNAGIRACCSEFIVIHDDDDSWEPQFLEKTIAFLSGPRGVRYGGAITQSLYVSEEVQGETVIEHGRWPYQDWVRNVQIAEMACGNFFPPIAFVFRRAIWEKVGGYNESLPVLGDWFFNMEFLLQADIGVLPEPLAFYHHRDRGDTLSGLYSNSVIGGVSKHEEFAAVARNEFLRRHADKTNAALSVVFGYIAGDMRGRLNSRHRRSAINTSHLDRNNLSPHDDRIDLYWAVGQINQLFAEKKRMFWRSRSQPSPIRPNAGWDEVQSALRKAKIMIPPPGDFDENAYLFNNPDVAKGVKEGDVWSGYMHYLLYGRTEGRLRPSRRERC